MITAQTHPGAPPPIPRDFSQGPGIKNIGQGILVSITYWMTLVRYLTSPGFNFLYEKCGVVFDSGLNIQMSIETNQVMKILQQAELRQQEAVRTTDNTSCLERAFLMSPNVPIIHKKPEF